LVEPEKRGKAFAYVGASFSAGFVLGPAFGGILLDRFGFSAPFLAAAAFQFATLLLTIFMLPESRSRDPEAKVASFTDVLASLTDRRVSPVLMQSWAFSLGLYAWFGVYALLLQAALNFTARDTSYMMAAFGAFSVFMQLVVVSRVYDSVGDRVGSNIGIGLAACGFFLTPFIHSIPTLIPNIVLFSAGMALARPGISSILSARAPVEQRGSILGTASALDNLSGVLMPPVSTGLLGRYGQSAAGIPSLIFAVVALGIGLAAQRREAAMPVARQSEATAE
jgi:predicted MFS family arabinose efflux permease